MLKLQIAKKDWKYPTSNQNPKSKDGQYNDQTKKDKS